MIREFDKEYMERVLWALDDNSFLFPQFALKKNNNELKLLGSGGFSSVYEMYNRERPDLSFALKVTGFRLHSVSSAEFWSTGRIQWILSQESAYIMRVLELRELVLYYDDRDIITAVKDATKEAWEETEKSLHLQFVLMEKLCKLIEKDRFSNVRLLREELCNEAEVIKFAFEIGQALATAHTNKFLHRDIKLENIFWDENERVYKLGDFGIAKWTENGNAETIVYTDGYGAPEIERRLNDNYNATADIYSLGISLYLLLNDMKFPGSDGYYSKVEVQYDPDFVFPAPVHASEGMTRIIRKMCAYYPKDRYQALNEAFLDLAHVLDTEETEGKEGLFALADLATETFREEKNAGVSEDGREREMTRAERKEEQRIIDHLYRRDSIKYFFLITIILVLLFKGFQPHYMMAFQPLFFVLPIAVVIEALLQSIKEFQLVFGALIIVFSLVSIVSIGFTAPHIVMMLFVLTGRPVLTLASGISTGLWMLLEYTGALRFLDHLYEWHLGWVFLGILIFVVYRYFFMRAFWGKTAVGWKR